VRSDRTKMRTMSVSESNIRRKTRFAEIQTGSCAATLPMKVIPESCRTVL